MPELASQSRRSEEFGKSAPLESEEEGLLAAGLAGAMAQLALLSTETAGGRTRFDSACAPPISLEAYAARLHQHMGCSGGCYVLAFIYLDRLLKRCPDIAISRFNCHRLLLVSLVVAAKFHDDDYYANSLYAKIGGVHLQELNRLEGHLIDILGWRLQASPDEYSMYQGLCSAASQGVAPMPARYM